jgi:hypothetical protein
MNKNNINWDDPNLDLDEILWIPDIDRIEWFINDDKKSIDSLLNLNLNVKFTDSSFELFDWNDLLWVIEYSITDYWTHIDFFWTINWNLDKVVTDNEFIQKFKWYFWENSTYIKWIWKKTFIDFLKNFQSDTVFSFIPLEWAQWFYDKILWELEWEWIISILWKSPEYKFILL